MAEINRTLLTIGSGPGIGRAVTNIFASRRYNHVALIARNEKQLEIERSVIQESVGPAVKVKTYALDVIDSDALIKAIDDVESELGKPECVFYNAARVLPSELLKHDVKDMEYDFKVIDSLD